MLREKLRNRKGFTLIEIIVVIVILAVLMAVAVPSVMSYMSEGQNAKYETIARAALISTQTAVAKDYADDGKLDDAGDVARWASNYSRTSDAAKEKYGTQKSYGDGVTVFVNEIKINTAKDDMTEAVFYIRLSGDTNYRKVTAKVNNQMIVDKVGTPSASNGIATKYTDA
ncbi:MAG: prepilin-type N-terminal cleavage/methylation domain-containing protein [Intestinibaculum porci]|uniref:prepilin-type N-terminal cleavage/methylation domain-containing protein n=1 Tax=Intestinibaculum porci TaxID=2487118 RepID=UPI003EFBD0A9